MPPADYWRGTMRRQRLAATVGLLGVMLLPTTIYAAPATTVIEIDVDFGSGEEVFTATGGVVCAAGTAESEGTVFTGGGRMGRGVFTFHLVKTLTCDDGSGTFQIRVDAATAPTSPGTIGGFAVIGGTGDYVGLRGAGSLVGAGTADGILDRYTGHLTIAH